MIRNFRHRGLETFFRIGAATGIRPSHAEKVRLVLARLQAATTPGDLRLPGLRLHKLAGWRPQWPVVGPYQRQLADHIRF